VTVAPGGSAALWVSGAAIASTGRAEFRPVVTFLPPDPCVASALVSAEVVDVNGVVRVFAPPDPCLGSHAVPVSLGLIDVPQGQVARLIAVSLFQPHPIMLQFQFINATGVILSQQTMTVAPGTSATLDFTQPTTTTTTIAQNSPANGGPIRAQVSLVEPDSPAMAFLASAEVFDPVSELASSTFNEREKNHAENFNRTDIIGGLARCPARCRLRQPSRREHVYEEFFVPNLPTHRRLCFVPNAQALGTFHRTRSDCRCTIIRVGGKPNKLGEFKQTTQKSRRFLSKSLCDNGFCPFRASQF
jgi:hypothetical protein